MPRPTTQVPYAERVISFLVVGLALGVLARAVRSGPGRPQVMATLPVSVIAALIGGVAANWLRGEPLADASFFSLMIATVAALAAIGVLELTHSPER